MPLLGPVMEGRNQVFQRLKPPCVALSQAALAFNGPKGDLPALTRNVEELQNILSSLTTKQNYLDGKLADYVFFPLSQVLKVSQKVSIRSLELTLQCLAILIEHGWRSNLQPQLAAQIVILCTFMADKQPKASGVAETSDELRGGALQCLRNLFNGLNHSPESKNALIATENFPQLGQTFSTLLDCIEIESSAAVQVVAFEALESLVKNVATREIHAGFLPGIVSILTKVLTPQTKQRRNHKVLIGSLNLLSWLFISTLSAQSIAKTPVLAATTGTKSTQNETKPSVINHEWLDTAAKQLKPAISSIVRLRTHSREDVKAALVEFCFTLLNECQKTLSSCSSLALETVLILAPIQHEAFVQDRLLATVNANLSLLDLLQNTVHDWLQNLPTLMLSADEPVKAQKIHQIITAYQIIVNSQTEISLLNSSLGNTLRDSVVATLQMQRSARSVAPLVSQQQSLDLSAITIRQGNIQFGPALVLHGGQQETLGAIEQLVKQVGTSSSDLVFSRHLLRSLQNSQGDAQVATFWLLLSSLQTSTHDNFVDEFLDIDSGPSSAANNCLEDLYSFSVDLLTANSEEHSDPRLQALALRTIALRAQVTGSDFQYELIDVLYPVLHTLATPDEKLQLDSVTTLNIITSACGYDSVKALIVENVDYLTNAVALKLNAFDISPQAPQVLLMMVRLAGSSLLPYLEDTVESIFAALEDYHGYPLLVQLLFQVLGVVAEEGTKAPQLMIADGKEKGFLHAAGSRWQPTSVSGFAESLRERIEEESRTSVQEPPKEELYPRQPWKSNQDVDEDEESPASDRSEKQSDNEDEAMDVDIPPPAPKTYQLLLKITELTQQFLPSASPSLRASLLALIKLTAPAISKHENSFLPLINTLWPEIVSRLHDPEHFVIAAALDIVAVLCEYAGDFMRSRVLQLWPTLSEMHEKIVKEIAQPETQSLTSGKSNSLKSSSTAIAQTSARFKRAITQMRTSPGIYNNTSTRLCWNALTSALTKIVRYAPLPPDYFDEALDMLEPLLEEEKVRSALEGGNADAVWLVRLRNGAIDIPDIPAMDAGADWNFAKLPV